MTSLETQDFARLDQPDGKDDLATSGSRTWRLLVAATTILAIVALGALDGPNGGSVSSDQATSQGSRPMDGWGKWGGYTP